MLLAWAHQQAAAFISANPAALFDAGQQGYWLDVSDLTTMFQDSAGTTPAVVGQPVGRINDKSGRGNHFTQATTAAKPILRSDGVNYYLEIDGVDDILLLTAAPLYAAGSATIIIGARGVAQVNKYVFAEGNSGDANPFYGTPSDGNTGTGFCASSRNNAAVAMLSSVNTNSANGFNDSNRILTFDDSGTTGQTRVNRGAWTSQAYARGATTLNRSSVGALARVTAGNFFTGRFYGTIARAVKLSDRDLMTAENYIASKSGVTL